MTEIKSKLMFVEDDEGLRRQLKWGFSRYDVTLAGDRRAALDALRLERPEVVVLDLGLPPDPDGTSEGFATLEEILALVPTTKVIVMTGNEGRDNGVKAISLGAFDFYQKPIDSTLLGHIVDRAFRIRRLEDEGKAGGNGEGQSLLPGLISDSDSMRRVAGMVRRIANTDVTVLLTGESGTGKEVLAQAIHELSPRADRPFVALNCGAIPENLLESELFGHEKGAFTGAIRQAIGKFEQADGGTLFLDEIGDLPLALQVKLLRVLQERRIERVGGRTGIPINVRVVCATNQDLPTMIDDGRFRGDLYYRLNEFPIEIPPLRERDGDVPILAQHFLELYGRELGRRLRGFTPEARAALTAHPWPGNVRELQNVVKRSAIMAEGGLVSARDLGLSQTAGAISVTSIRDARAEAERAVLRRALSQVSGNISQAAKLLGVSRPTLYDLMRQHDIKP